jgi:hypothetical protein
MITKDLPNKESVDKLVRILQVVDLDFECLSCCQIVPSFISNLTEKLENLTKKDADKEIFLGPKFDLEKDEFTSSLFTPLNLLPKEKTSVNNETPYHIIQSNIQSGIQHTPQKSKNFKNKSIVFDNHNSKKISEMLKLSQEKKELKKSEIISSHLKNKKSKFNEYSFNQNETHSIEHSVFSLNKKHIKGPSINLMNTPNKSNQSDLLVKCHDFFQRSLFKMKELSTKKSQNKSSNDKESINICKIINNAKSEIEKSLKSSPYSSKIYSNKKSLSNKQEIMTPLFKSSKKGSKLFQSNQKVPLPSQSKPDESLKNPFCKFRSYQNFSHMEHLLPFLDKIDLQKTIDTKKEDEHLPHSKIQNEFCLGKREFPIEGIKENMNLQKKKN